MKNFLKSFLSLNPVSITAFIVLLVLILYKAWIPFLDNVEYRTFDLRFEWRDFRKPSPAIVLAVIDEKSLDREGRWPWPRSKMAELVKKLSDDGAKIIGFDFFFTEPDENSTLELLNDLDDKIKAMNIQDEALHNFISENKIQADNDLAFANAIKESNAKVILSYFFHRSKESLGDEISEKELESRVLRIKGSVYPLIYRVENEDINAPFILPEIRPYAPEVNLEVLSRVVASSGYIDEIPDEDGIIRKTPLAIKLGEDIFTPFSVQCAWQYLDKPNLILRIVEYVIEGIEMGNTFIPTDEQGRLLINYLGPVNSFPRYSITDILNDNFKEGAFKDKIVVVGSIATGAHDLRHTPFSGAHPGVEVHATIIDNILSNDFISKPSWANIYDVLAIILLGALIGVIIPRTGPITGLGATAGLIVIQVATSRWLFSQYGLWVNMVYPLLTIVLAYTTLTAYHYLIEERSKRFLHSTFSSYLSPEIIEEMIKSNTMPELGGEARVLTAFFTDIQGFTAFSEMLTAQQLVELLNEFLTAMTDIIIREKGTLDKYEGDAIIAFFGAPMNIPDHALRACRVAVTMQSTLLNLREKWKSEKMLPGEPERNIKKVSSYEWAPGDKWPMIVHEMMMRIGINSGEIVVGNMGSAMRKNYTMMGDAVNLAARLEAGARQFGIYTAVSEHTLNTEYPNENSKIERVMDKVEARFIDTISVLGRSEPVKIYELCAMKGGLTSEEKRLFEIFDRGIRCYRNMQWDDAIKYFRESAGIERILFGETTPSEVYIKRCQAFKIKPPVPPGQKWDGVFRLTTK